MSNQHYLITEEQLQELKELDLPYAPSIFDYFQGNFAKYKGHMRMAAYRAFGWEGGPLLEKLQGEIWRKRYDSSR